MSWFLIAQRIGLDFLLHLVYFPLWWYTVGAKKVLIGCFHMIQHVNMQFAPGLWAKNLFVPMFGQHDWQGRITSFFVRFFNIIFRSLFLLLWSLIVLFFFGLWMFVPLLVMYMMFLSLNANLSS